MERETMDTKSWPEMATAAPYKAKMCAASTGWVYVVDKDGKEIATCFHDGADRATAIAYALNATFPVVTDDEADAEDAAEADAA